MSPVANTSRSLSPTMSTMAWKSSAEPTACWMLLITASSALRCSVSFSRRVVSLNRCTFPIAIAAWLANDWMTAIWFSVRSSGLMRRMAIAPMALPSRMSGTAQVTR